VPREIRRKAPDQAIECAWIFQYELIGDSRVFDRGKNLRAITDDPRIVHEAFDVVASELSDDVGGEVREGGSKRVSTSQDCDPGQSRLKRFETELFE